MHLDDFEFVLGTGPKAGLVCKVETCPGTALTAEERLCICRD